MTKYEGYGNIVIRLSSVRLDLVGYRDVESRTLTGLAFHLNSPSEELGQNDRSWLFRHGRQELKNSRNGRVVAREGIKQRFPELGKKKYILTDVNMMGPVLNKSIKEFQEIFMR